MSRACPQRGRPSALSSNESAVVIAPTLSGSAAASGHARARDGFACDALGAVGRRVARGLAALIASARRARDALTLGRARAAERDVPSAVADQRRIERVEVGAALAERSFVGRRERASAAPRHATRARQHADPRARRVRLAGIGADQSRLAVTRVGAWLTNGVPREDVAAARPAYGAQPGIDRIREAGRAHRGFGAAELVAARLGAVDANGLDHGGRPRPARTTRARHQRALRVGRARERIGRRRRKRARGRIGRRMRRRARASDEDKSQGSATHEPFDVRRRASV